MKSRKIGAWNVPAMGLGCMPLSGMPHSRLNMLDDRPGAIAVIHAALDAGVRLLDTADIYSAYWDQFGHNEVLVAEAVKSWNAPDAKKKEILIATKGGITRGPGESWGRAASVDYLLRAAEASALRLGVEQIDLWQHHRLDPTIPFETQFENVLVLKERGLVREIGVSNYNAKQLTIALGIAGKGGIASVQNERSPKYLRESDVLKVCEDNAVAYLPWSPLGGVGADPASREFNSVIQEIASAKSVSPFALTIAWHLHSSPTIIPIPGATKVSSVLDSFSGLEIDLSADEMARINSSLKGDPGVPPDLFAQPAYRG
ncbi:Tas Predicted oxidoreductases (related to aryl-alcohol dehydrogenases) [Candidatus Nanopelagicaceae bacterium]